jgi:hypothetical protein
MDGPLARSEGRRSWAKEPLISTPSSRAPRVFELKVLDVREFTLRERFSKVPHCSASGARGDREAVAAFGGAVRGARARAKGSHLVSPGWAAGSASTAGSRSRSQAGRAELIDDAPRSRTASSWIRDALRAICPLCSYRRSLPSPAQAVLSPAPMTVASSRTVLPSPSLKRGPSRCVFHPT